MGDIIVGRDIFELHPQQQRVFGEMKDAGVSLSKHLQMAFSKAEVSTILRSQFQVSPNYSRGESNVIRMNEYIERREQALKLIAEFNQIKNRFVSHYAGRYVAFYNGNVVDSDMNRAALARRFYEQYGNVPVCIAKGSQARDDVIYIQ